MKHLVFFLLMFCSINTVAQLSSDYNLMLFPQGYDLKLLNSYGNSSIINNVSNISSMNPAAITGLKNYSAGISYQLNTKLKDAWIADIGMKRIYNFFPQSFGAVTKLGSFSLGVGLGQKYNGTKDFGKIPITTPEQPDGTGEFIEMSEENLIQSYSLSTAFSFAEILQSNFDIKFGLKYSLNYLHHQEKIWINNLKAKGYSSSFGLGITTQFNLDEQRYLQFGLSYELSNQFNVNHEIENNLLVFPGNTPNTSYYQVTYTGRYTIPSELNFDIAVDAAKDLMFLGSLRTVFWSNQKENYKDQLEISFSTLYEFSEIVNASLGFYSNDFKIKNSSFKELESEFNAFFITAGLKLNISMISIDLACADSHLFSGEFRKQTIIKLAAGVQL